MEKITLYTTHCPLCRGLERELKRKEIIYEEVDDIDRIIKETGLSHAPILKIGEKILTLKEAQDYLKKL